MRRFILVVCFAISTPGAVSYALTGGEHQAIALCDTLAANPSDPTRPTGVRGVEFYAIEPRSAVPPCEAAVKAMSQDGRIIYQLARAYHAAKNYAEAREQYLRAISLGHMRSAFALGQLYYAGNGVVRNYNLAFQLYERAARAGIVDAIYELGYLYYEGKGTDQNYELAFRVFTVAATAGDADAMGMIGVMYDEGRGVPPDIQAARSWYAKAAALGNETARENLRVLDEWSRSQRTQSSCGLTACADPDALRATERQYWQLDQREYQGRFK